MMRHDSQQHHRRSIRLRGYDYTQAAAYFVTVCVQDRECLFGQIVDEEMRLTEAGQMVQSVWDALPQNYPGVDVDEFVVMPNHIHGIIVLTGDDVGADDMTAVVGATPRGCPDDATGHTVDRQAHRSGDGQAQGPAPTDGVDDMTDVGATPRGCPDDADHAAGLSLPDVVHRFKSFTTAQYRHGVKHHGWIPFPGRLWQRNYYEHVVRNHDELRRIRQYIEDNPAKWALDPENPTRG
jgi:REP element-mobilizing transposase RayT